MLKEVKIGDKIPNFSIQDYEGIEIESEDLIGNPFVLYFYPKDDTPGCTLQACSFRDNMELFNDLDVQIIGVSPDNAESHNKFMEKHRLNFTLLCDEDKELAKKFGAIQEKENQTAIIRSTFIVDAEGIVRWIEKPVVVDGHSQRVLEALESRV